MGIPYRSQVNLGANDPIDILFACGQHYNQSITYLDAWIAFREIPKRDHTFYPNKDKQFRVNKYPSNLSEPAFKPRTYTLTGQEKTMGRSLKEEEKPDITFGIDGQAVLREQTAETDVLARIDNIKNQREQNIFTTGKQEQQQEMDYSLALKKIYDLIEKQEYERHGIGGKAMRFLGWKLPTSAAAVKHIINHFLNQKANDKNPRKVLSKTDFTSVSQQIQTKISNKRTGMGDKNQSDKSWYEKLTTTHRDDKTFNLYDEIYDILQDSGTQRGENNQDTVII